MLFTGLMPVDPPKYLTHIPQPLLSDLVQGRWLPVVGAGLSMNAHVSGGGSMPNWRELGERIGQDLPPGYASDSNPLETLSAYKYTFGPNKLIEAVRRELHVADAHPGRVHEAFCNLPFEVVATTNVEQLLERQYGIAHGSVLSVMEEEQLRILNPYPSPKLVKLHGDLLHPSSLVLTESDYDNYLISHPLFATWLANQLIEKTGVLIGYSLDDPDFRSILAQVSARLGSIPPDLYVLDVDADPVRIARYMRRGVRVVNIPSGGVGWDILADLFQELGDYWSSRVSEGVTSSTTVGRMVIRARTRFNRVILFLVSNARLSDYDENVFPTLVGQGLFPITEEDIQQPRGNELASLDLLLRAANQVVVEADQINDPKLNRAVKAVGRERILLIVPPGQKHNAPEFNWCLERTIGADGWEAFSAEVIAMLRGQRDSLVQEASGIIGTVRGLLDEGQVQMAFLAGVVELEGSLYRLLFAQRDKYPKGRPWSLRDLLVDGASQGIINIDDQQIRHLADTRNRLAHGRPYDIDLRQLTELVLRLLEEIGRRYDEH
jgi:SIR2-like domain